MHKLVVNDNVFLFLNVFDMKTLKRGEIRKIKNKYLKKHENCYIYNYLELRKSKEVIRDRIYKIQKKNQKVVFVRKTKIRNIGIEEKKLFLEQNSVDGNEESKYNFGAFYYGELISVFTVNDGEQPFEFIISRFSNKIGFVLNGMLLKFIKKFIRDYKVKLLTTYSNLNQSNRQDNIYLKNDFKLIRTYKLKFEYFLPELDIVVDKYAKIDEEMEKYEYWDCGKLRYDMFVEGSEIIFGYIYQIENKINGKIYIGQTIKTLSERLTTYKRDYKRGKMHNTHLSNSFKKYGWDNFVFEVIDNAKTMDELNEKEKNYIKKFNTMDSNIGYNKESGGDNFVVSDETREKMSKAAKGRKQSKEWVAKRIPPAGSEEAKKHGRKKTEEEKRYLSQNSPKFWLGKERSEETKRKISETNKKRGPTENQKKAYFKKVYAINITNGNIEYEFESCAAASRYLGVSGGSMSINCRKNKTIDGCYWTYDKDIFDKIKKGLK